MKSDDGGRRGDRGRGERGKGISEALKCVWDAGASAEEVMPVIASAVPPVIVPLRAPGKRQGARPKLGAKNWSIAMMTTCRVGSGDV